MTAVTLELVQAKHAELAEMIKQLEQQPSATRTLSLPAIDIELRVDEHYAGAMLDDDGRMTHHVILLPQRFDDSRSWPDSMEWAKGLGGDLPTPEEQSLLYANCRKHLPQRWCWSNKAEGEEYAWFCYFSHGLQTCYYQSLKGAAVAVRRVNP